MVEIVVIKIIFANKRYDKSKIEAKIIEKDKSYMKTVTSKYYKFHIDMRYKVNIDEDSIYDIERLGISENVVLEANKALKNEIEEDDILNLLEIEDIDSIKEETKKIYHSCDNNIVDKVLYYKNKDNLLKLIELYNLDEAFVEYALKQYAGDIVKGIIENPYILIKFGLEENFIDRICNGDKEKIVACKVLLNVYKQVKKTGDVFLIRKDIEELIYAKYYEEKIDFKNAVVLLVEKGMVVLKGEKLYLKWLYEAEQSIANNIKERVKANKHLDIDRTKLNDFISIYKVNGQPLNKEFIEAISNVYDNNFAIIAGSAGTGKTTFINIIVDLIKNIDINKKVEVVAFTGKAVSRLNEEEHINATTIHRYFNIQNNKRNVKHKKKKIDFLIIDESSMIDLELFSLILTSIQLETRIVLIGDEKQILPIEPGSVFQDLITSGYITTSKLTKVYRQNTNSLIYKNSINILENNKIEYDAKEFRFIESDNLSLNKNVIKEINKLKSDGKSIKDIVVISAKNNGDAGTKQLNKDIQQNFKIGKEAFGEFFIGNRVMQVENDYKKKVFNGEVGVIIYAEKYHNNIKIKVKFKNKLVEYQGSEINKLELANALTIHKMQGDEAKNIILVIDENDKEFLNKSLLYVAITRATEKVTIIGDKNTFEECLLSTPHARKCLVKYLLKN